MSHVKFWVLTESRTYTAYVCARNTPHSTHIVLTRIHTYTFITKKWNAVYDTLNRDFSRAKFNDSVSDTCTPIFYYIMVCIHAFICIHIVHVRVILSNVHKNYMLLKCFWDKALEEPEKNNEKNCYKTISLPDSVSWRSAFFNRRLFLDFIVLDGWDPSCNPSVGICCFSIFMKRKIIFQPLCAASTAFVYTKIAYF